MRNSLIFICDNMYNLIVTLINAQITFNTGVLVFFLIFMIGGYLFVYLPFAKSLQDDVS